LAKAAGAVEPAIAGEAKLDAHKLRADFPIFEQRFHGKPLAYLDSAVSAQKPRQVLDAQRELIPRSRYLPRRCGSGPRTPSAPSLPRGCSDETVLGADPSSRRRVSIPSTARTTLHSRVVE
jgi:cysteine desulfurase/selenocysteine lyase